MKQTFNYQFYCRDCKKDKRGEAPIELSVTINGQRIFIHLPYRIAPDLFRANKQPKDLIRFLDAQRVQLNNVITEITQQGLPLTAAMVKKCFKEGVVKSYTVGNLLDDYLQLKKGSKISKQLYHKYEFVADIFATIISRDMECSLIKNAHVRQFVAIIEEKYKNSTAISYLTLLRSFIKYAIDNGQLRINPLQNVKIKHRPRKIDYLTEEEIKKLRDVKLDTESLRRVRDCAIFQISSGLSYCDCLELTEYDLKEKDGVYYISKNRHKTGTPFFAVILPDGVDIYNRYHGKIPFISNQKYNLFLKALAERAGITKNCHTHLFRHTYCTILLNHGVSLKTVSRCAGHVDTKMTESFYAHLKDDTVLKEVSKAINQLIILTITIFLYDFQEIIWF